MSKKMSKSTIKEISSKLRKCQGQPEEYFDKDHPDTYQKAPYPDGTEVLYDTFPEGVDFCGIVVNNMIYATGISKTKFLEIGVATSIEVERAENIRVVIRGDE